MAPKQLAERGEVGPNKSLPKLRGLRPAVDGTSPMKRECHVRIYERLGLKFRG
jgi:hypothetical protein